MLKRMHLSSALTVAALVAVLSVSLLPQGLAPKWGGRCGQALCFCPADVHLAFVEIAPPNAEPHCMACEAPAETHAAPAQLTLHADPSYRSSDAQIAFQVVFTGLLAGSRPPVPVAEATASAPQYDGAIVLTARPQHVPTPPPRA